MADQNSRQDENKFAALIAHTGTAGTSETIRLVADANGNLTVSGTVTAGGSNVNVVTGTQQTLGTVGVLNAGSVVVTTGTINLTAIGGVFFNQSDDDDGIGVSNTTLKTMSFNRVLSSVPSWNRMREANAANTGTG